MAPPLLSTAQEAHSFRAAAALVAPPAAQRTARLVLPIVLSGRLSLPLVAEVKERNEHKREGGARRRHQDERGEPVVKQMLKQE
jgi:hypothetical protein